MDSVRFGRALGFGARSAAKALTQAIDAASAPTPAPEPARSAPARSQTPQRDPLAATTRSVTSTAAKPAARGEVKLPANLRSTGSGLASGGKRFGQAVWSPLVRLSGVLWLEMTGAFFGIFALFAGQAAWTHRADLRSTPFNHDAHRNAFVFLAMMLLFGYFCISSFVRAYRK